MQAQSDEEMKESSEPMEGKYLDDVVNRTLTFESKVLPYESLRESDVPWSKKMWRLIETREKLNIAFRNPNRAFFTILIDKIKEGKVTAFEDEFFKEPLTNEQVQGKIFRIDSVPYYDPETYEETIEVVKSEINPDNINRYRIKEVWYFDKESSMLKVRILGISPLVEEIDEITGELKYELPLFWVYYPELREYLADEPVPSDYNDMFPMTWYDLFENRMFSSYIIKTSNVLDLRLKDIYAKSNTEDMDILLESERLKEELFNFEHDLWSY
jgi:gliding motility associated protien GldN